MSVHPFRKEHLPEAISEVNVVPLADVSLVLLIILMVLSPMMTQSMLRVKTAAEGPATPPVDKVPPPPESQELVLVVTLRPDGVLLGDRPFPDIERMAPELKQLLEARKDRKVFLVPHPEVTNGGVVDALEVIKKAGAESVALVQTRQEAEPADVTAPGARGR